MAKLEVIRSWSQGIYTKICLNCKKPFNCGTSDIPTWQATLYCSKRCKKEAKIKIK